MNILPKKLNDYLKENKIKYETIVHPEVFTAQETAAVEHISGKEVAKVLIVRADNKADAMLVLPANRRVDMEKVRKVLGAKEVRLTGEKEFQELFPDSQVGAMPPFGNLYDLPCYLDKHMSALNEIVFNAGTHRESIKMSFLDYEKLAKPFIAEFAADFATA